MTGKHYFKTLQRGVTLIELSVVLLILVALAGLAVPYVGGIGSTASCQTTDATMHAVKEAIMGGAAGAGFYGDTLGRYPSPKSTPTKYSLAYLFEPGDWPAYNTKTGVGWRGPYLQNGGVLSTESALNDSFTAYSTTTPNGKAHIDHNVTTLTQVFDAWHRPIILQVPTTCSISSNPLDCARLVSAGGDAIINTPINDEDADLRNDDRVLFLKIPDPKPGGNIPCDQS
ncbi:MAG: prepilin-type N-terminal cleavage/methylation domain-containing protein [Methylobacter sp.]|uniref:Prepilin-type N-terminal cleavage/methylation domain-containing protein n=1 Tax=Candidatus Methylobacter titanis TaxID=3053457 RepID=A0AA43Q4C6_9GAMM|nr:prepilin-type N-terminal cleavage/methylation domain-containing protein [Candidatus Methylobacter titanis]